MVDDMRIFSVIQIQFSYNGVNMQGCADRRKLHIINAMIKLTFHLRCVLLQGYYSHTDDFLLLPL